MEIISLISNIVTIISGVMAFFQWIITVICKNKNKRRNENLFLPDLEVENDILGIGTNKKKRFIFICKISLIVFLCSATLSIILYFVGNRPPEDENEAYIWYLEHTENDGSPKNLNALGECYFFGRGTEVNYDKAFLCFEDAAQRNKDARYNRPFVIYKMAEENGMKRNDWTFELEI